MNCRVCGRQLPQGASICPNCGTVTSNEPGSGVPSYDPSQIPPYSTPQAANTDYNFDPYTPPPPQYKANTYPGPAQLPPTQFSPGPHTAPSQFPPTQFSSGPYTSPAQLPPAQFSSGPYASPAQFPPYTPPQGQQQGRLFLIIGVIVLALLLVGGGSLVLLRRSTTTNQTQVQTSPTATPNTNSDPYVTGASTLIMNDPLHDNSQGNKWDEAMMNGKSSGDISTCGFKNGAYHLARTQPGALVCDPEAANFINLNNLAFEARLTIIQGASSGIAVRFDQVKGIGYLFSITATGTYGMDKVNFNNTNSTYTTLDSGSSKAIKTGLNQTNLIALVADGNSLSAYVNSTRVDTVKDSAYTAGQIGVFGGSLTGTEDVIASNARVWTL